MKSKSRMTALTARTAYKDMFINTDYYPNIKSLKFEIRRLKRIHGRVLYCVELDPITLKPIKDIVPR